MVDGQHGDASGGEKSSVSAPAIRDPRRRQRALLGGAKVARASKPDAPREAVDERSAQS
jgi:hypothetical protein